VVNTHPIISLVKVLRASTEALLVAEQYLLSGKFVVLPTDTAYALSCLADDQNLVIRAWEIKRRGMIPMPVFVSSIEEMLRIVRLSPEGVAAASKLLPGPITFVGPLIDHSLQAAAAGRASLGVRIPNHWFTLALLRRIGRPLLGTSANISGNPSPRSCFEAILQLGELVDLYVDANLTVYDKDSTVVRIEEGRVDVIRLGPVGVATIRAAFSR